MLLSTTNGALQYSTLSKGKRLLQSVDINVTKIIPDGSKIYTYICPDDTENLGYNAQ